MCRLLKSGTYATMLWLLGEVSFRIAPKTVGIVGAACSGPADCRAYQVIQFFNFRSRRTAPTLIRPGVSRLRVLFYQPIAPKPSHVVAISMNGVTGVRVFHSSTDLARKLTEC
jgi:hypothetical protein